MELLIIIILLCNCSHKYLDTCLIVSVVFTMDEVRSIRLLQVASIPSPIATSQRRERDDDYSFA